MQLRRVPGTSGLPSFLKPLDKPVFVEASCIEPEPEASDLLRSGQTLQQFAATPALEVD